MKRDFCGRCGLPVIRRDDGRVLSLASLAPSRHGLHLPEGGTVTPVQAVLAWREQIKPVGHETHRCPAIEQGALFEINAPAQSMRGGL